jgi:hypothetical protein
MNEKTAYLSSIMGSAAEGLGQAIGDKSLTMIGKIGDSIMSSMQRRNKEKILKQCSLMYPQLSGRNKQKVDVAFEMICTLNPGILNNTILAGKIIDDASKSNDVLATVKSKLSHLSSESTSDY